MSSRTSSWAAETLTVCVKEWRSELRTRYALNTIALFAFTTLVTTSMALGPLGSAPVTRPILPVVLWLVILFAASAGLPRAFVLEEELGTGDALRLTATPSAVFCGKALYNLSLLLALEALAAPLFLMFMQLPVQAPGHFALALAAGGFGMAVGSTLIAAMVAQAQGRGPLFAVLAFPILLPLLLFAVKATTAAVLGETSGAVLQLVLLYDGTLAVAGLMLFPAIWNP